MLATVAQQISNTEYRRNIMASTNLGANQFVLVDFDDVWVGSIKLDQFIRNWTGFRIWLLVQNMSQ